MVSFAFKQARRVESWDRSASPVAPDDHHPFGSVDLDASCVLHPIGKQIVVAHARVGLEKVGGKKRQFEAAGLVVSTSLP